jgi:hypothetical protein
MINASPHCSNTMDYATWNDSIGARFFSPEMKDRRVHLYVTADMIREIGKLSDAGLTDFLAAVQKGPQWVMYGNICERAYECFSGWRRRKLSYPPYLAYLGLFTLAAGLRGDFAGNAYYPRLRKLLGEPVKSGTYPGFSEMQDLWDDLENWTQRDMRGALGIFQSRVTSRFIHVGIPISQTILSEQERLALPSIFADAAIDPASSPSEALLINALIKYGGSRLRPRTRTILEERSKSQDEFEALIDAVLQELSEWDGTIILSDEEKTRKSIYGTARLWCEFDEISQRMQLRLLCRSRHEFPEDGLVLKFVGESEQYQCDEFRDGWSTPLRSDYEDFDAAQIDWCGGIRLREVNRNWRFSLSTSPVRLLVSGASEGLSGYIEAQRLTPSTSFLLLVRDDCEAIIQEWGRKKECAGLEQIEIESGLPRGWSAYSADCAIDDALVRDAFPALSFPTTVQISFEGGVSASPSTYFDFALPKVSVVGASPSAQLFCNGESLGQCSSSPLQLSWNPNSDPKLSFEVRERKQAISRHAIYVQVGIAWPDVKPASWCDSNGQLCSDATYPRVSGALSVSADTAIFGGWVNDELLPADVVVCPADRSSAGAFEGHETGMVSIAPEPTQPAKILDETEIRNLISGWKSDVTQGIDTACGLDMKSRPRAAELREGFLQYVAGGKNHRGRNWFRCIKELLIAMESPDDIVRTIAAALLQLVFYKLNRQDKILVFANREFPMHFERLKSFMTLLAGQHCCEVHTAGIGITDISPLQADIALEQSLFSQGKNQEY